MCFCQEERAGLWISSKSKSDFFVKMVVTKLDLVSGL